MVTSLQAGFSNIRESLPFTGENFQDICSSGILGSVDC